MNSCSMSEHSTHIYCFTNVNFINSGGYGNIYSVEKKCGEDAEKIYAMKTMNKILLAKKNIDINDIQAEIDVMKALDHPFIIKLKYEIHTKVFANLVMEYASRGSLYDLLHNVDLTERQATFYMKEVILAIEYMHSKNIMHRDIKPQNIMIDSNGHTKLIDFGLAVQNFYEYSVSTKCIGTLRFMAPEMLDNGGYGRTVDWWAFGVTYYYTLTGCYPFLGKNKEELKQNIVSNENIEMRFPLSSNVIDLLRGLFDKNPKRRIGSLGRAIKHHVYFKNTSWSDLLNGDIRPQVIPPLLPTPNALEVVWNKFKASTKTFISKMKNEAVRK